MNDVVVSTGYQTIPKERAAGSFVKVSPETRKKVNSTCTTRVIAIAALDMQVLVYNSLPATAPA